MNLVTLSCHITLSLTLSMATSVQVQYEDYVTAANTLSAKLREEEGCEVEILMVWCGGNAALSRP